MVLQANDQRHREKSMISLYSMKFLHLLMNKLSLMTTFTILAVTSIALATAGLTMMSSAIAQEENATLAGNETMYAENMIGTNTTEGTGNISGVEDPGF
jgi:hypothetical protein